MVRTCSRSIIGARKTEMANGGGNDVERALVPSLMGGLDPYVSMQELWEK